MELGRNTAEEKSSPDFVTYMDKMTKLKEELVKLKKRNPYFVVQSRKGPKVLEMFFSKEERIKMKILSEHALPFLFPLLAKESKTHLIIIVDDAIYYGTTVENLASEIKDYAKLYDVQVKIVIYTAIKAMWSKEINEAETYPIGNNVRKGYEHFFVKLLMSDIRSIPTSMEVEFPIVTYHTSKHLDQRNLQTQLKKFYDGRGRLYGVDQYNSKTFKEKGVERFSILLNCDTGASFSKMRFYIDDNAVRVAFISPHLIPNNILAIEHIFEKGTESVKRTWNSIVKIVNSENKSLYGGTMHRNQQRTLVVAANFILSLHLYYRENDTIQKILSKLSGLDEIQTDFDEQQLRLRYIFYDDELVSNILLIMEEYKNSPNAFTPNLYSYNQRSSRNQIFEATGYPPDQEKEKLQDFNTYMLENSTNMSEKLSALFFNQTTLIEKWSRQFGDNTSNRLKFGYNFRGLMNALEVDCKDESFVVESNLIYRIHRWIDRRIDQGCIVPQYIIDNEKGQWDRVFRPGENEEAILSTLTRFVAYSIDTIKKEFEVQYIPEFILKKILCIIVEKYGSNLQDLLRIRMVILGTGLSFVCEDDYTETNKTHDVVDYLKSMLVLDNCDNYIDISKRFEGTEQVMNTSLSTDTERKIAEIIRDFHNELKGYVIDFLTSYRLCNYIIKDHFTPQQEDEASEKCIENLLTALTLLGNKDESAKTEAKKYIYEAYCLTKLFIMPKSFSEESMYNPQLYEKHLCIFQRKFSCIIFVINILLLVFYSYDTDKLKKYVDEIDNDNSSYYLDSSELLNSIRDALNREKSINKIAANQNRMRQLLDYINMIKRIE